MADSDFPYHFSILGTDYIAIDCNNGAALDIDVRVDNTTDYGERMGFARKFAENVYGISYYGYHGTIQCVGMTSSGIEAAKFIERKLRAAVMAHRLNGMKDVL